ncbi:unnamed protein product [Pieris brassicae]|uniref:Uncharacterized protein n=1 Tax=Pieris brassicae TaxID=7116 RepID=A0A9P0TS02_PIEBR|nr:unnamed protein product [Pieris brassicae]
MAEGQCQGKRENPTLEEINAWRACEDQEMLSEWERELVGARIGKYTIEALRPLLQRWVRKANIDSWP